MEEKLGKPFLNLSLHDTMTRLLEVKVDKLKSAFKNLTFLEDRAQVQLVLGGLHQV